MQTRPKRNGKMKNVAEKGAKRTKSNCECVKATPSQLVADDVRRRSRPHCLACGRCAMERRSNQPDRSTRIRLVTSAATGHGVPILPLIEMRSVLPKPIRNLLISMIVSDNSRLALREAWLAQLKECIVPVQKVRCGPLARLARMPLQVKGSCLILLIMAYSIPQIL